MMQITGAENEDDKNAKSFHDVLENWNAWRRLQALATN